MISVSKEVRTDRMRKISDFTPFQWIIDETERIDVVNWTGSRIENFIPRRFTHYGKLMRISLSKNEGNIDKKFY